MEQLTAAAATAETAGLDRLINSDSSLVVFLVVVLIAVARVAHVLWKRCIALEDRNAAQGIETVTAIQAATNSVDGMQSTLKAAITAMDRRTTLRERSNDAG